jgi:hypothetical protein
MKAEIERAASALSGKTLWRCLRAADMATFAFGERRKSVTGRGGPREIGEWALHVQCAWRILQGDRIIVGDRDLAYPENYQQEDPIPDEFDWDVSPNRRDQLLASLFMGHAFVVRSIEVGAIGSLSIRLTEGLSLDIFPNDSVSKEYWRLFEPDKGGLHFVVTPRGLET